MTGAAPDPPALLYLVDPCRSESRGADMQKGRSILVRGFQHASSHRIVRELSDGAKFACAEVPGVAAKKVDEVPWGSRVLCDGELMEILSRAVSVVESSNA